MIHVERSNVPVPKVLSDDPRSRASIERAAAEKFFEARSRSARLQAQQRFVFKIYKHPSVVEALVRLFHFKCAYCETKYGDSWVPRKSSTFEGTGANLDSGLREPHTSQWLAVEHFRPKGGVTESPTHPGYWWLAGTWSNLLLSCSACGQSRAAEGIKMGKANRFPLEQESARAFKAGEESAEAPMLLDPTRDNPAQHLVFATDGRVSSDTTRGHMTIAVLGLNRKGLVEARRRAAEEVERHLGSARALIAKNRSGKQTSARLDADVRAALDHLTGMTGPMEEFAAMKRQLIGPLFESFITEGLPYAVQLLKPLTLKLQNVSAERQARSKASFDTFEHEQSEYSLTTERGRETFRSQRRQLEHVSIRNFKGIKALDLDFPEGSGRTGWLMLLGENSTGKSTVLQAIALTLAGADYFAQVARERGLVFTDLLNHRARKATIEVKMSGFVAPHTLTLTKTHATCTKPNGDTAVVRLTRGTPTVKTQASRSGESQSVVLAYGATRLLPRGKTSRYGIAYSRIDNLFDPFLPLFDADDWLSKQTPDEFNASAIVLKDLLNLDPDAMLLRSRGRVLVQMHDDKVPLKQLSDGYQAVVAMCVDVLEVVKRLWPHLAEAEGIVLLDEIGAHLHPRWKMRIVESLRRALPGMQFVVTTHEPLCLRGLAQDEAVVMRRDANGRIEAVTGLPSPADFRVDQLLTSEFFGLNSTVDEATEKLFDEYYALMALRSPTREQETRLAALKGSLEERRYFGNTLREHLMYQAIDRLIAEHKHVERKPLPKLNQQTVRELSRLWNEPLAAEKAGQ